ncbi:MAG: arylsulfatase [Planctomycetales bacterium]|nr:arylsulfatase [Planctomycetales bacterium]
MNSSRRILVQRTLLAAVALLAAGPGFAADDTDKPNIIFILADDLGYGDLGCFGQTQFATPRIDQMAAQGLTFTDHYAGSTVCAPSRACLMTGQHTGHVYQRFNGPVEFRQDPLDVTVATLLKRAGYRTALIGKSGLSCRSQNGALPNEKGFDHFFGYINHNAAHRYYPPHLWRDGERVELDGNHGKEGEQYSGDLFLADTLQFLDEAAPAGPFFLHLSLQQPHADLCVPDAWKEPFITQFKDRPFPGDHYRAEQHPKATFAGMVTYLDHTVGAVLDKLQELGVADNTLVIFSSDNGAMSEGGWDRNNFRSSGPLRGGKRDMYEGGVRVPTIAWWPGTVAAGEKTDHVSAFWDFLPTACELAGAETPENIDGISYAPTLKGRGPQPEHEYLYWEFYEQGAKQAVRRGKWKGVRLNVGADPDGPLEVYDLENDLGETRNVAAEHPEVAAELARIMAEAHVDSDQVSFATGNRIVSEAKPGPK